MDKIKKYSFIDLCKYKKGLFVLSIVFNIFKSMLVVSEGLLIKNFFDFVAVDTSSALMYLLVIILVAILHIVVMYITFRITALHDYYNSSLLRLNIFKNIINKFKQKTNQGTIQNVIRDDVGQIQVTISWLITIIGQVVLCVFALVILFSINALITCVTFVPLIAILFITRFYDLDIMDKRHQSRDQVGKVNSFINSSLSSVNTIKLLRKNKAIIEELKKLEDIRNEALIKDSIFSTILDSTYDNVNSIGTGIILLLMANFMSKNNMTLGDFSIFIFYLALVFDSIESFANFFVYSKQTKVSIENINDKLEINEDILYKPVDISIKEVSEVINNGVLKPNDKLVRELILDNLSVDFKSTHFVLKDININVGESMKVGICGKTGSGKSVLLECINGFYANMTGNIRLSSHLKDEVITLGDYLSYSEQKAILFDYSIKDNILLGKNTNDKKLNEILDIVEMNVDLKSLPDGINTKVGVKGKKLSGGQKQRIVLARMLANESNILLIDDFTSSLDNSTAKKIWKNLKHSCNDNMMLIATNNNDVLKDMDYIYLLDDGEIVHKGQYDEMKIIDMFNELLE